MKNFLKKVLTNNFDRSISMNVQPVKRLNEISSNDSYLISQSDKSTNVKVKSTPRWRD